MSKLFDFSGNESFFSGGPIYPNPKEVNLCLSLGHHVDLYFPPCKRSRVTAPFVFSGETIEPKEEASIEVLPDECLFEIFKRLSGGEERSSCSSVSKRWLMLLSNIRGDEFHSSKPAIVSKSKDELEKKDVKDEEVESVGCLSRSLEGKKATDVRLAAISVGTSIHGGLGKLMIRGSKHDRQVTVLGLRAISRGSPSLKVLSLWNLSSVGDEGLREIANGCHLLEKLDLSECPLISDEGLLEVAKNCPNLTDITIESCSRIGNDGIQAFAKFCPTIKSVSIRNCPLVGDQGITSLISSTSYVLKKVKLHTVNITDMSLAVIGHYGKAITDLSLTNLINVSERGFWVMGNGHGLQVLKSLAITSCHGATDVGLAAVGKGSPNLKHFCLRKCNFLSDNGLLTFAQATTGSLESLQLEECHRITQVGFFGVVVNCGAKLKSLSLVNCLGLKDLSLKIECVAPSKSLRSVAIRNCPGFGNNSLALLGHLCPQLQHLNLCGLEGITDAGFLPLFRSGEAGLMKVNLSGCVNLTDKLITSMTEYHGWTLELLHLDGCRKISDTSLGAIAENCPLLRDLDMSKCEITDFGVAALAQSNQLNLQILSLSGCSSISDKSLTALRKLSDSLVGLNLQQCKAISSDAVDLLGGQLWGCDILS